MACMCTVMFPFFFNRLIQYNCVSFLFLFYKIFLLIIYIYIYIYIYYIPIYKISKRGLYDLNGKGSSYWLWSTEVQSVSLF